MIKIGIDYYPEHWERSLCEEEAARMQAVAHGTDLLSFFRWRTSRTGADPMGRCLREWKSTARDL